jgi:hypothetical protein
MPLPGKQLAPIKPLAPSLPGAPLGAMSSAALPLMNLSGTRPGAKRGGRQRKKIEQ